MNHLQAKHLEEYKRCTNDYSKSCKTQSTLHSFSHVCPPERATAITKCIAEFVAWDLRPISFVDGQGFTGLLDYLEPGYKVPSRPHQLYQNLVGGAVFNLQLSICFTFRISRCRKLTSVAALLNMRLNTQVQAECSNTACANSCRASVVLQTYSSGSFSLLPILFNVYTTSEAPSLNNSTVL